MGPYSEGGPSSGGRGHGGQTHTPDSSWYQPDREAHVQDEQLPRPNGAFASENMMAASPVGSLTGRDTDGDSPHKNSGERNRSRPRGGGKSGSGQLRVCKKCGESLTGQFVRALGGTFHLDCFRCQVWEPNSNHGLHVLTALATGLRRHSSIEILPGERRNWRGTIPPL